MSAARPYVVQFGAGAIGRGFLGQLWTDAGYEVVFVEADPAVADALTTRGAYPLRLATNEGVSDRVIGPVRALLPSQTDAIADALAGCAWACTAVGAGVFPRLAPPLAAGIARRPSGADPLNVLLCENAHGAAETLRAAVAALAPDAADRAGFVDTVVGRMVPPPTPDLRAEDPLLLVAEPYARLPFDRAAWRGPLPDVPGLLPAENFAAHVARKLFCHNGGHAVVAYHGWLAGHEYIWQAVADPAVRAELLGFWRETGDALIAAHGFDPEEQRAFEADLLRRFANRALGDTCARVGRDPARKLRRDDRLIGAGLLCLATRPDAVPIPVCRALAAALRFDAPDDPAAVAVRAAVERDGPAAALASLSGLPVEHPLMGAAAAVYNGQASGPPGP